MPQFTVPINGPNGPGFMTVNANDAGSAVNNASQGGNYATGAPIPGGHQANSNGPGGSAQAGPGSPSSPSSPGSPSSSDLDAQYQRMLQALASGNREAFEFEKEKFNKQFEEAKREYDLGRSDSLAQFEKNFGLSEGSLTGVYNGSPTEAARQFNLGLGKSLLDTAVSLRGPQDYLQYQQYTRGGQNLLQQLTGNEPIPQTGATAAQAAGQVQPASIQSILQQLGLLPQIPGAMGGTTAATDTGTAAPGTGMTGGDFGGSAPNVALTGLSNGTGNGTAASARGGGQIGETAFNPPGGTGTGYGPTGGAASPFDTGLYRGPSAQAGSDQMAGVYRLLAQNPSLRDPGYQAELMRTRGYILYPGEPPGLGLELSRAPTVGGATGPLGRNGVSVTDTGYGTPGGGFVPMPVIGGDSGAYGLPPTAPGPYPRGGTVPTDTGTGTPGGGFVPMPVPRLYSTPTDTGSPAPGTGLTGGDFGTFGRGVYGPSGTDVGGGLGGYAKTPVNDPYVDTQWGRFRQSELNQGPFTAGAQQQPQQPQQSQQSSVSDSILSRFGLTPGQSFGPNNVNPARYDAMGAVGRALTRNLAETKYGYDPTDFENQINAQRPTGRAPRTTRTTYRQPTGLF